MTSNGFHSRKGRALCRHLKYRSHIAGRQPWYPSRRIGRLTSVISSNPSLLCPTKCLDVCGFFFRELPIYTPSSELDAFLRDGPPPVYIGFGSIVIDDPPRLTSILEEAVRAVGVRAIISRGWSKLGGSSSKDILYIGDCPHEWLFQNVSAVVHHGGAGTTACSLRFGKPTAIVPFFGDQPFWGKMIAASGAGPEPIPQKSLTAENLAEAIQYCLTPQAKEAAKDISNKMQYEAGVKAAVESFHRNLPLDRMRCQVIPDQPASWIYKKSAKPVFLSKLAAQILLDHLRIESKNLQSYDPTRPNHLITQANVTDTKSVL